MPNYGGLIRSYREISILCIKCQPYSHWKRKLHVAEGYICIVNEASAHYEVCIWQHHQCFQEDLHCDCSLMIRRVELISNENLIISVTFAEVTEVMGLNPVEVT